MPPEFSDQLRARADATRSFADLFARADACLAKYREAGMALPEPLQRLVTALADLPDAAILADATARAYEDVLSMVAAKANGEAAEAPPAAPERRRVDVASRQPDPFELNQLCIVCETVRFHRNGPRQKVCPSCRALDPRANTEALRALYQQKQQPAAAAPPPASDDTPCVGPSVSDADDVERCPLGKRVTRTSAKARGPLRCPDCHLEHKRRMVQRRLPEKRREDRELMERIGESAPPPAPAPVEERRFSRPIVSDGVEFETTGWDGREGLTSYPGGSSLGGSVGVVTGVRGVRV